jgi:GDP-L-fucose synthase
MDKTSKIYVAGHRGMVGSAVVRALRAKGYETIVVRTRGELDLTNQAAVREFYAAEKPDVAIIAAARVGGIHANNTYPAEFMMENLAIAQNTIGGAFEAGVQRLLFLGSTCIYPKFAEQPIKEESLLTGPLEATNEAYAIAKIAGLKMCEFYRRQYGVCYHSAMPTNLYGAGR